MVASESCSYIIRRTTGQTDIEILATSNDLTTQHKMKISRSGFTDASEALTVQVTDREASNGVYMCSHSATSIVYFDMIDVSPLASADTITSYSASASEEFDCLAIR